MRSLKTTTIAGTITADGSSQVVAQRDPRRDLLIILNPTGESGQLFVNFGAAAVVDATFGLAPGQWTQFDERCGVPGESIHVTATNVGHRFVVMIGRKDKIE